MARYGEARASAPVMATKVAIPRRRGDTLRRTRLVDALHQMIDRQLYLVVAPAGYGKTTLLVDFASDSDVPVCWYSLGRMDNEPAVFLDYLVAAIQARFPRFGADTRRAMAQANFRTDAMSVLATLVNEIQERIPDYFALVLDDYHEVNDSPAINQLVDALLKHAPENLKLMISSRTMPKLQLSRLAALRQAAGVGAKDLRFTVDEVRQLMRDAYETVLPDRVVEELTVRSEGWITGIILTTHTMWQGLFESMIRNSGQEQLYSYLAGEVFERQTPVIQRFLLSSSVLDDLEPAVAGALAGIGRSDEVLRQLADGNLFVTELEGRKRVYRYHHLFRDFLRSRLDPTTRQELEGKAGRVYQQRSQHEQAIGHLLAAKAYKDAAESILALAEATFNRGRLDTLADWIDALPVDVTAANPRLGLWRAQVALQRGELDRAVDIAHSVETAALQDPLMAAEAEVARGAALRLLGATDDAIAACQHALTVFGAEVTARRAQALRILGTAYWRQGALPSAKTCYEHSYALFAELDDNASSAYLQNDLGAIGIFLGQLGEARQHLTRSAAFWERSGNAGRLALTLNNLGVLAYLEEDYREAIKLLEQAQDQARSGLFTVAEGMAACSLGDVYRDSGHFDRAEVIYQQAMALVLEGTDRAEVAVVLNSMAQSYRLQGLHSKAELALRRAQPASSGYRLAQINLTAAICAIELGRYRRAESLLGEAQTAFNAGGARYQAARVLFFRAFLEYRRGRLRESDAALQTCLAALEELGFAQFLAVEAGPCKAFLEQAAARGVGEEFLTGVLRRAAAVSGVAMPLAALAETAAPPRTRLRVRALGRFEVDLNGRAVAASKWGIQSARELLLYLLLHPNGASKDQLMAVLTPDAEHGRANSRFHVTAYHLRRALGKRCLLFEGDYYRLDPEVDCEFDVWRFHEASISGDVATLEQAVGLYRGRFAEGFYGEWLLSEQRRLEDEFLQVCTRLARLRLERGEYQAAADMARRGLEVDFGLEELHEIVISALNGLGAPGAAGRHLEQYAAHLQEELGLRVPERLELLALSGRP